MILLPTIVDNGFTVDGNLRIQIQEMVSFRSNSVSFVLVSTASAGLDFFDGFWDGVCTHPFERSSDTREVSAMLTQDWAILGSTVGRSMLGLQRMSG